MRSTTQTHSLQFGHHQRLQQRLGQLSVLTHGERDVFKHIEVCQQRAVLEQHTNALAQCEHTLVIQCGHILTEHFNGARCRLHLTRNKAQ